MTWKRTDVPIEGVSACPRGTATPCACNGTGRLPAPPPAPDRLQYGGLQQIPPNDPRALNETWIEGRDD